MLAVYIRGVYTGLMNKTLSIKTGTEFRILLGMPRTGKVTKVTAARVFFNTVADNGETVHEVTTRAAFANPAMVEVI